MYMYHWTVGPVALDPMAGNFLAGVASVERPDFFHLYILSIFIHIIHIIHISYSQIHIILRMSHGIAAPETQSTLRPAT